MIPYISMHHKRLLAFFCSTPPSSVTIIDNWNETIYELFGQQRTGSIVREVFFSIFVFGLVLPVLNFAGMTNWFMRSQINGRLGGAIVDLNLYSTRLFLLLFHWSYDLDFNIKI